MLKVHGVVAMVATGIWTAPCGGLDGHTFAAAAMTSTTASTTTASTTASTTTSSGGSSMLLTLATPLLTLAGPLFSQNSLSMLTGAPTCRSLRLAGIALAGVALVGALRLHTRSPLVRALIERLWCLSALLLHRLNL